MDRWDHIASKQDVLTMPEPKLSIHDFWYEEVDVSQKGVVILVEKPMLLQPIEEPPGWFIRVPEVSEFFRW